jgi:hypothetical protein
VGLATAVAGGAAGPGLADLPGGGGAVGLATAVAGGAAGPGLADVPGGGGAVGLATAVAGGAAGPGLADLPGGGGAVGLATAVAGGAAGPAAADVPRPDCVEELAAASRYVPSRGMGRWERCSPRDQFRPKLVPRAATATRVGIVSRACSRTVRSRSASALTRSPLTRRNRERSPAASRSLTRPCTSGP